LLFLRRRSKETEILRIVNELFIQFRLKNQDSNLFIFQHQNDHINVDFKGIDYFVEFETPRVQSYEDLGNIVELISCNQIKSFVFRSSLTSKLTNFDSFNDKWVDCIRTSLHSKFSSVLESKEFVNLPSKNIFEPKDLEKLKQYFSNSKEENQEKKDLKRILATEKVFGNKDLTDSLYKRFSISVDERNTLNASQPDVILNSTDCILLIETENFINTSMDDFLDRFSYLSLQFDKCWIIVEFPSM
jgi:hypothetical protein